MLPELMTPVFDVTLPYTNKTIRVRPFLVKEEKLLLMAAQSKSTKDIIDTTLQVVQNCLIDSDLKAADLPFFEVDYLFITLRAKSVGEVVEINFKCNNPVGDIGLRTPCGHIFPVALDILQAKIVKPREVNKKIALTGSVGAIMGYPNYREMKTVMSEVSDLETKLRIIKASVDSIWEGEKVYTKKDITPEDLDKFVDNLTKGQLELLEEWVDNFPSFEIKTSKVCPKCGFDHAINYGDFRSFF